jgi:phage-related minor tail protein
LGIIKQASVKGTLIAAFCLMKNIKKLDKQQVDQTENLVLDTKGGEMPDADQKSGESASEAAKVFENKNEKPNKRLNKDSDQVRDQLVVDEDGDQRDNDTEVDPEFEKKAG